MSRVLYGADKDTFISDVLTKRFVSKMKDAAALYRVGYGDPELNSWIHNAPEIQSLLILANAPSDTYVSFEYRVPHGCSRIDCMLYGKGNDACNNVIHIELKQWGNNCFRDVLNRSFPG